MSEIIDLIRDALVHPVAGGALLCWAAGIPTVIYWVKRSDDGKETGLIAKGASVIMLATALVLSVFYISSSLSGGHEPGPGPTEEAESDPESNPSLKPSLSGHERLGISDLDWNCSSAGAMEGKYKIEAKKIRDLAQNNDLDFLYLAAMGYSREIMDHDVDPAKQHALLLKAAKAGSGRAMSALAGYLLSLGNSDEALSWFGKARKTGIGIAFIASGQVFSDGDRGISPDREKAIQFYQQALSAGCEGTAGYLFGSFLLDTAENSTKASEDRKWGEELLQRSAATSSEYQRSALQRLVRFQLDTKDYLGASLYLDQMKSICADLCAVEIAETLWHDGSPKEARQWYRRALDTPGTNAETKDEIKAWLAQTPD